MLQTSQIFFHGIYAEIKRFCLSRIPGEAAESRCAAPGATKLSHTFAGLRHRLVRRIFISIYFLELVGASAITALGYVACSLLQIDWSRSAPLWFAGYLFVYNSDRLYADPADATNTPLRFSWAPRLRPLRVPLIWLSAGILVLWPLVTARGWMLFPLTAGIGTLWFYSRPILRAGYRVKDLPYVKSLLAPGVIASILVIWPAFESGKLAEPSVWLVIYLGFSGSHIERTDFRLSRYPWGHCSRHENDCRGSRSCRDQGIVMLSGRRRSAHQYPVGSATLGRTTDSCAVGARLRRSPRLIEISACAGPPEPASRSTAIPACHWVLVESGLGSGILRLRRTFPPLFGEKILKTVCQALKLTRNACLRAF